MPTRAPPRTASAAIWGWLSVASLLAMGALVVGVGHRNAIEWQPAAALREPWRFWSAAWVHLGTAHLASNLAGAALVAALGVAARLPLRAATAWALAWPLTHAALLLRADITHYGGLSGVLHAGVAVAGFVLVTRERGRRRAIAALMLGGLGVKVLVETPWAPDLPYSAMLGIATVPFAHAAGTVAGLLCAWLLAGSRDTGSEAAAR